jgi:hypothetical protein
MGMRLLFSPRSLAFSDPFFMSTHGVSRLNWSNWRCLCIHSMPRMQQHRKHDVIFNDRIRFERGGPMTEFVTKHSIISYRVS